MIQYKIWSEWKVAWAAQRGDADCNPHEFLLKVEASTNSNISSIIEVVDHAHFLAIHAAIEMETDINLSYIKLENPCG